MVNTMKIGNAFVEAVSSLIGKSIAEADFNTTQRGRIIAVEDQANNIYRIKHQDAEWKAQSVSGAKYELDTQVFVVNLLNNTQTFYILGSVNPKVTEAVSISTVNNSYDLIGMSLVTGDTVKLGSHLVEERVLYDEKNNTLTINSDALASIQSAKGIVLSAYFQTNLDVAQTGGNYGLIFDLVFKDENNDGGQVHKQITLDTRNVIGNPYALRRVTKVESVQVGFDPSKFLRIDSIKAFVDDNFRNQVYTLEDFNKAGYNWDIFISNIQINGANPLTEQQLTGYKMHINYSTNGNTLDTTKGIDLLKLVGELKVKGVIVTSDVEYYWFRQNATVFRGSDKYSYFGGEGWECLNPFENTSIAGFKSGQFYVSSSQVEQNVFNTVELTQKQTTLKCVAVYGKTNWIEGTVKIYNQNVSDQIKIISSDLLSNGDNKVKYYLDAGSPTLTCQIDTASSEKYKEEDGWSFKYTWIQAPHGKKGTKIVQQTEDQHITRGQVEEAYEDVKEKESRVSEYDISTFQSTQQYTSAVEAYENLSQSYCYGDTYYNYPIKNIVNYTIISCGVQAVSEGAGTVYIGTGSITLYNVHELANTYSLNIENGSQVFQYDDKGNSPCSPSLEKPLKIPSLTFTLLDDDGEEVSHDQIRQNGSIKWIIPKQDTLLVYDNGIDEATAASYYEVENLSTISYSIENQYDSKKKNNDITLLIQLNVNNQKINLAGYTNLTFAKDGDPGTNGTDYVAKITPYGESTDRVYLTSDPENMMFGDDGRKVAKLEFQLYNNSIKQDLSNPIINYFKSLNKTENEYYSVSITGNNFIVPTLETATFDEMPTKTPVNILRGQYKLGDLKYYAEYPININYVVPVGGDEAENSKHYRFKFRPKTGYKYVQYASDGTSPNYDNTLPFEVICEEYVTTGENSGYYIQKDDNIGYTWQVIGNLKSLSDEDKVKKVVAIEPKDKFDGSDLTSAIYISFTDNNNYIGYLYAPIYMYLNRYNNAALNDWDGNSIDLGEDKGVILAPQIGAGQKEDDGTNTFTGVVMGRQLNSNNEEQVGLFGYEHGQRSVFLDSKTGNATFGKQGAGQIKIDATTNEGTIQSGDYSSTNKEGMKIKFSSTGTGEEKGPYIKFGSGDFSVSSDGHIHAAGGGDIAGWNVGDDALTSPNGKLKLGNTNINFKDSNNKTIFDVTVNDSGSSASIAGWSFDEYKFSKNNAGINSVTSTGTNNGSKTVDGKAVAFYAGDTKFYVTHDGYLKSVDGQIANWNITSSSLNDGNIYLGQSSKDAFGQTGIQARIWDKDNNFIVSTAGKLYSKSGKIGGWNITETKISANNINLNSSGSMQSGNFSNTSQSKTGWSVSGNGNAYFNQIETNGMTANNIDVNSGNIDDIDATNIRATSGKIGKVTIDENGLTGDNWWVRSDNAHFKGLIVDTNDIKSSSDGGIKSSGYSGSGGSGWSMPSGSGKPSWNYDGYSMNPITVKTVGVLSLSKVHPQDSGNYYIPSGLQDLTVVTSVNFDAKTVTTTSIKDITGYAVRDWIVQGWGNSTTLPQYEVMAANNYTGASTAENT